MKRALAVAVLAMCCWVGLGARDASWARQEPVAEQASQPPQTDLRLLSPGTKLTIHLVDGSKVEGVLREVQNDAIVLEQKHGKSATIMLTDIKRLETRSGGLHPVTRVLIVVGAAVGALLVVAVATC
jgi:hypothetical protein